MPKITSVLQEWWEELLTAFWWDEGKVADSQRQRRVRRWLRRADKKVKKKFGPKEQWYCTKVEKAKDSARRTGPS